ncbi:ankyrin-3-like isoform X2 [Macrobrachium nipponense]|uniref:ankyrin-3-like isoform X2 n=1 Tax=Macrobrachium nipponense TaxID=159736 RepID=UPI0030C81FAA
MLLKGLKNVIWTQFIIWMVITDGQPSAAAPEPGPLEFLSSIFGGGETLEPTVENLSEKAAMGDLEAVKDLVSRGADVNFGGRMPLWHAVKGGNIEVVKYLLDSGANPDGDDSLHYKGSIVAVAAEHNRLDILDLLFASGASVKTEKYGVNILFRAVDHGHLEAARKLIQAGVDVDFYDGFALLTAAEKGYLEIVKEIVKAGANINAGNGWIVDTAGRAGQTEVMKVFIEAGVAKENLDTAMHAAAAKGHLETVKLLFDNGADPNFAGTLRVASQNGNLEIVKLLLDGGAQITYKEKGYPLHIAASKGHIDVVALLVEHGGDINRPLTDDMWVRMAVESSFVGKGWTVMHVIAHFGYPHVKELLDLGAEINVKDASGNTPLQVAVGSKKLKMAKEFLRFCADASLVNNEGKTAQALAVKAAEGNMTYFNEKQQNLVFTIKEALPDKLAATEANDEGYEALKEEFSALVSTSPALKEQLKNISYDGWEIKAAIRLILEEESRRELPKVIGDLYCKPALQKEHKVSIGTEYLAKCECVPGEGPTMTYTPVQEGDKCQQEISAQTESPTQEPAASA